MNPIPYLQHLLMLALNIVLPRMELEQGEEGRIAETTHVAIRRFLVENRLTIPEGLQEQSPEWLQWIIHRLEAATRQRFIVYGVLQDKAGQPLPGVTVRAFDRDLPSLERRMGSTPQMLGESTADAEGRFQITYTLEQFQTGEGVSLFRRLREKHADLSFRVFDRAGQELSITRIVALDREYRPDHIIFNAPAELEVSIFIESRQQAGDSEYEKLLALIAPVVADVSLAELTEEDIVFLINELGLEQQREVQQRIEWLRWSALLVRETNLPAEAFYGWARTGLPDLWPELHTPDHESRRVDAMTRLLDQLAATAEESLVAHLLRAVEDRIIPARVRERASAIAYAIRRRAQKEYTLRLRLELAPTGEPLVGYTVTTFDADANNRDLGTDVTDAQGEFVVAYFAGGDDGVVERSLRFRVRGPAVAEAVEMTQRIRSNPDVPVIVRLSLPDAQPTLKQLRADGRIEVPDAILQTLEEAHGIRSFADIRRRGGLNRIAELGTFDSAAVRRLDALADLDRLSSDLNETSALLQHRYDSVAAIAETTRSEFIGMMSATGVGFSERRAAELHVAAKAQTDILDQIFAGIAIDFANGIRPSTGFAAGDYFPPFPEE
jgi:hypothetical protein